MSQEMFESDYHDIYDPNACLGDLGKKWCNFKWKIHDLQLNPLETIQSPVFTTRLLPKTYWYLLVKLQSPGDLTAIKISLRRLPNAENPSIVDVIFKVFFFGCEIIYDVTTFEYFTETPRNVNFCCTATSDQLKTGYVKIECKLRPNRRMVEKVRHSKLDATLRVDLRKLLQSGELYDTIIRVGREQLEAHYAIIRARMPQMIPPEDHIEEKKYIIEINDLPPFVVKEMLKYAYTGQAYLDFESVSSYRDILLRYGNFFYTCCWKDHPFAETSFHHETVSLEWDLNGFDTKEEFGMEQIQLFEIHPNELDVSLDLMEWDTEENILTLSLQYCAEKMPRPTLVSCKYSIFNSETRGGIELGKTEILLCPDMEVVQINLCSLLEVWNVKEFLCADNLILETEFKFCYGSSESSIKNLYIGQFDASQCTSCALLTVDMEHLYNTGGYEDIVLEGRNGVVISAHKAILFARWKDAEKYNFNKIDRILMDDYDYNDLSIFLYRIYVGNAS